MNISAGRLSIIEKALIELNSRPALPILELKELLLRRAASTSEALFDEALSVAVEIGLIELRDEVLQISSSGKSLVSAAETDAAQNQRRILSKIITKVRRDLLWVAFVNQSELGDLPKNEYECFEQLGLIDYRLSDSATKWWEGLRKAGALFDAQVLKTIGDEAEQKSIQYEQMRIAQVIGPENQIQWVSRENDLMGFDILSFVGAGPTPLERLRIEVKKLSSSDHSECYFFLSRNESQIALASPNYVFHLWKFHSNGNQTLHLAPKEAVLSKLPKDNGLSGIWDTARIFVPESDLKQMKVTTNNT